MASNPITSWQIDGENVGAVLDFIFFDSRITADSDCSHVIKRLLAPWKNSYDNNRQCFKMQRHHFANKGPYSQSYSFSSSHVWMWQLDHKEGWSPKNWCFWTVVPEKTLMSLASRRSSQSILKKVYLEYFFEGQMLKLKVQYFGHLMQRADSLEKTLMLGKNGEQEKRATEDEMVGWYHWLNGYKFEQTQEVSDGQRSLVCCSSWSQSQTWFSDWTVTILYSKQMYLKFCISYIVTRCS